MTFGERMRLYRRRKGMTQRQLAASVKLHTRTVNLYENDVAQPKIDTAKRIAAALGVDVAKLVDPAIPVN